MNIVSVHNPKSASSEDSLLNGALVTGPTDGGLVPSFEAALGASSPASATLPAMVAKTCGSKKATVPSPSSQKGSTAGQAQRSGAPTAQLELSNEGLLSGDGIVAISTEKGAAPEAGTENQTTVSQPNTNGQLITPPSQLNQWLVQAGMVEPPKVEVEPKPFIAFSGPAEDGLPAADSQGSSIGSVAHLSQISRSHPTVVARGKAAWTKKGPDLAKASEGVIAKAAASHSTESRPQQSAIPKITLFQAGPLESGPAGEPNRSASDAPRPKSAIAPASLGQPSTPEGSSALSKPGSQKPAAQATQPLTESFPASKENENAAGLPLEVSPNALQSHVPGAQFASESPHPTLQSALEPGLIAQKTALGKTEVGPEDHKTEKSESSDSQLDFPRPTASLEHEQPRSPKPANLPAPNTARPNGPAIKSVTQLRVAAAPANVSDTKSFGSINSVGVISTPDHEQPGASASSGLNLLTPKRSSPAPSTPIEEGKPQKGTGKALQNLNPPSAASNPSPLAEAVVSHGAALKKPTPSSNPLPPTAISERVISEARPLNDRNASAQPNHSAKHPHYQGALVNSVRMSQHQDLAKGQAEPGTAMSAFLESRSFAPAGKVADRHPITTSPVAPESSGRGGPSAGEAKLSETNSSTQVPSQLQQRAPSSPAPSDNNEKDSLSLAQNKSGANPAKTLGAAPKSSGHNETRVTEAKLSEKNRSTQVPSQLQQKAPSSPAPSDNNEKDSSSLVQNKAGAQAVVPSGAAPKSSGRNETGVIEAKRSEPNGSSEKASRSQQKRELPSLDESGIRRETQVNSSPAQPSLNQPAASGPAFSPSGESLRFVAPKPTAQSNLDQTSEKIGIKSDTEKSRDFVGHLSNPSVQGKQEAAPDSSAVFLTGGEEGQEILSELRHGPDQTMELSGANNLFIWNRSSGRETALPALTASPGGTVDAEQGPAMALRTNSETGSDTLGKNLPTVGKNDSSQERLGLGADSGLRRPESTGDRMPDASLQFNMSSRSEMQKVSAFESADSMEVSRVLQSRLTDEVWSAVEKFRATSHQDWVVNIRPDPETQLNLKIKLQDNQLHIQATLESGNWDLVAPRWPELQVALAERGIQLKNLEAGAGQEWLSLQQHNQFASGKHEHRQTAADLAYAQEFLESTRGLAGERVEPKKPSLAGTPARSNRVLETWA